MYKGTAKGVKKQLQESPEQPNSFGHLSCLKIFLLIWVLVLSSAGSESEFVTPGCGGMWGISDSNLLAMYMIKGEEFSAYTGQRSPGLFHLRLK